MHDCFDGFFVGRVELADVNVYTGIQGFNLPLVCCQVAVGVVADVDGFGAVVGILVRCGAADACGGVGSWLLLVCVSMCVCMCASW